MSDWSPSAVHRSSSAAAPITQAGRKPFIISEDLLPIGSWFGHGIVSVGNERVRYKIVRQHTAFRRSTRPPIWHGLSCGHFSRVSRTSADLE